MNIVKTFIAKSKIEGFGLFANEFIPKGTKIWELQTPFDVIIPKEDFEFITDKASSMAISQKEYLKKYSYFKDNKYVFCGDDAKFANHSLNANTISNFDTQFAKVDINKGDEIFCDYREICDDFDEHNL